MEGWMKEQKAKGERIRQRQTCTGSVSQVLALRAPVTLRVQETSPASVRLDRPSHYNLPRWRLVLLT